MIWFGLVWFYSISAVVGYLTPIPVYTLILNMYCHPLLNTIPLHTVQCFQVLRCNTNNSIDTQLKSFKYCNVSLVIQFNITHYAHS